MSSMLDDNEKMQLFDIVQTDGFKAVRKLMKAILDSQSATVLKCEIVTKEGREKLYQQRCMADGAKKMLQELDGYIRSFNKKYRG